MVNLPTSLISARPTDRPVINHLSSYFHTNTPHSYIRSTRVHHRFFQVSMMLIFQFLLCCPIMCLCVLSSVCDVRYNFGIKMMFRSSLPPVVCRRADVLFTLFVFVCVQWCRTHILLCFSSSCVPYGAGLSGLSIFDCPFGIFQRLCSKSTNILYCKVL